MQQSSSVPPESPSNAVAMQTNSTPYRNSRAGLTLLEVVVVGCLLVVLLLLAIPGIQALRERSRQAMCESRLRRLQEGLAAYQSVHTWLPPGSINPTSPVRSEPTGDHHNWIAAILPHMNQQALARQVRWDQSVYVGTNNQLRQTQVAELRCPSAPLAVPFASNFAGSHHPEEAPIAEDNLGMLILNRTINVEQDVPDGMEFTLMAGEKLDAPEDLGWLSGTRATLRNVGPAFTTARTPAAARDPSDPFAVGPFGSVHPSGVHMVFVGGQTRMFAFDTDVRVLYQLAHRSDGTEGTRDVATEVE